MNAELLMRVDLTLPADPPDSTVLFLRERREQPVDAIWYLPASRITDVKAGEGDTCRAFINGEWCTVREAAESFVQRRNQTIRGIIP